MRLGNCEIHLCRTRKTLALQRMQRRCGEMADTTDLKYAAMPRSDLPLPFYCRFLELARPASVTA